MTQQETAKAQIERLERQKGVAVWKDELLALLRPVAEGKSVIVPVEPNDVIIDAMRSARRNCITSRVGGQTIEANYRTEMAVEFTMYGAMITAAQEK